MKFNTGNIIQVAAYVLALLLTACGGSNSVGTTTPAKQVSQMGGAMQGVALKLTSTVSTLAGAAYGADGTGAKARFYGPTGVVSDGANLYVADTYDNKIRKIEIATGVVTTLAGTGDPGSADGPGATASFRSPCGIATDGTNLYVTDSLNHKIRKIVIATGEVSSFTGTANTQSAASSMDGANATATFNSPYGISTDGTNLFVTDILDNKVRKIEMATGAVSSLTGASGTATPPGAADGAGLTAKFDAPAGITVVGGNLYVADKGNNKIRKIVIATGMVSSITGATDTKSSQGVADGAGSSASFFGPLGITNDGTNLYVTDTWNSKIRKIAIATGEVSSVTGVTGVVSYSGSEDGAGLTATFRVPHDITIVDGMLYVADTDNGTIRTIALSTAAVTTLAGNALPGSDGTGAAASFYHPSGVTTDGINLYLADRDNHKIRKIVITTGVVSTLAGTGAQGADDGPGATATFSRPAGITTDGRNLFVTDQNNGKIRKIVIASGEVSSVTGVANTPAAQGAMDGPASTATFMLLEGITTDGTNLYVADTWNNKIRKIVIASGEVSSVTGTANTASAQGAADGAASTATFNYPNGIVTDGASLYVVDGGNCKIRKIDIATGVVSSVTGMTNVSAVQGAADGAGPDASFSYPSDITTDGSNLYVSDYSNYKIRKIEILSNVVSSVTGVANSPSTYGAADGTGSTATFSRLTGITTDGVSLYVSDQDNYTIRKIK